MEMIIHASEARFMQPPVEDTADAYDEILWTCSDNMEGRKCQIKDCTMLHRCIEYPGCPLPSGHDNLVHVLSSCRMVKDGFCKTEVGQECKFGHDNWEARIANYRERRERAALNRIHRREAHEAAVAAGSKWARKTQRKRDKAEVAGNPVIDN